MSKKEAKRTVRQWLKERPPEHYGRQRDALVIGWWAYVTSDRRIVGMWPYDGYGYRQRCVRTGGIMTLEQQAGQLLIKLANCKDGPEKHSVITQALTAAVARSEVHNHPRGFTCDIDGDECKDRPPK